MSATKAMPVAARPHAGQTVGQRDQAGGGRPWSNSGPSRSGAQHVAERERERCRAPPDDRRRHEAREHQRVAEEDRVVEEGLRQHQRQGHAAADAVAAQQHLQHLAHRGHGAAGARSDCRQRRQAAAARAARRPRPRWRPMIRSGLLAPPWRSSQRGLSGTWRRTSTMPTASSAPIAKPTRQPCTGPSTSGCTRAGCRGGAQRGADPEAAVDGEVHPTHARGRARARRSRN